MYREASPVWKSMFRRPYLSMLGISKLDLFNDSDVIEEISFADLGLSCQTEIQYKKDYVFDITALVPMILLLGPDPGSGNTSSTSR